MKHLINPSALLSVITSDKNNNGAEFTTVSLATGKDYTFKIARKLYNGKMYTHIFVEKEYLNFVYLGSYFMGKIYYKGRVNETPASAAISWILRQVEAKNFKGLETQIEVFHLGSCLRCGKTLTDATSIELGLGPVCRG